MLPAPSNTWSLASSLIVKAKSLAVYPVLPSEVTDRFTIELSAFWAAPVEVRPVAVQSAAVFHVGVTSSLYCSSTSTSDTAVAVSNTGSAASTVLIAGSEATSVPSVNVPCVYATVVTAVPLILTWKVKNLSSTVPGSNEFTPPLANIDIGGDPPMSKSPSTIDISSIGPVISITTSSTLPFPSVS